MSQPPRIVTLVVDNPRGELPVIDVASPWWMESGPVVEAARLAFGVEVTVVRLLEGQAFPGGPVTYLVEAPGIDPDLLLPSTRDLVEDPCRTRYARIGGVADLVAWADDALIRHGETRVDPVAQVRTWNLSCLLRLPVASGGCFWLKAVPDFFGHEPAVMRSLASADSSLVPELIATAEGVALMAEVGDSDGYDVGPAVHFDAVARFDKARRQLDRASLDGVPTFGPDQMVADLERALALQRDRLGRDEHAQLASLIDETPDRWAATRLEPTLVHGDLHGGNLRLSSSGPDAIIDWGDASISNPLFDLAVLDSYTPDWGQQATNRWLDLLGCDRPAWEAFRPLAAIRLAVVYQGFCDRIEASEQIYHRDDIVPAVRSGLSFVT